MKDAQKLFGTLFALANKLQTTGDLFLGEITAKQWFLLACIDLFTPEKPSLSKLVPYVGSSRQNIKQLALKLEAKGFVSISPDPDDSRSLLLELTEQTRTFFSAREADSKEFIEDLFLDIDEKDIQTAIGVLNILERNTEKIHQEFV